MIPIPPGVATFLWKHRDIILVFLAVVAAVAWVFHKGVDHEREKQAAAVAEFKDTSRKVIVKTEKAYAKPIHEINSAKGGDAPVGPLTAYAIGCLPRPDAR